MGTAASLLHSIPKTSSINERECMGVFANNYKYRG